MKLGKYAFLNEQTLEVLTKSAEHGIVTIEHITEFVETDPKEFPWLENEIREAKKYLEKVPSHELTSRRFCSICGMTKPVTEDDTCTSCSVIGEPVQRALFALRATIIEHAAEIAELKKKQ